MLVAKESEKEEKKTEDDYHNLVKKYSKTKRQALIKKTGKDSWLALNFEGRYTALVDEYEKEYKKITPAQWASNIILSIHQLMLESWTYPLKSEEKGDIEYFVDKNKIFEIDATESGKTNTSADEVKVGKKYYYIKDSNGKREKCVIIAKYGETYTIRKVIDQSLNEVDMGDRGSYHFISRKQ